MQNSDQRVPHPKERARLVTLRVAPLILAILLAVSYLIAIPAGLLGPAQRLETPEIILAASLVLTLAFVAQSQYTITDPTLGPSGVTAHFNRIEEGPQPARG